MDIKSDSLTIGDENQEVFTINLARLSKPLRKRRVGFGEVLKAVVVERLRELGDAE